MKIPKYMEELGTVTLSEYLGSDWVGITEIEELIQKAVDAGYSKERMSIEYVYEDGMYLTAFRLETPEEHRQKVELYLRLKTPTTDAEEKELYLRLKKKYEKGTV